MCKLDKNNFKINLIKSISVLYVCKLESDYNEINYKNWCHALIQLCSDLCILDLFIYDYDKETEINKFKERFNFLKKWIISTVNDKSLRKKIIKSNSVSEIFKKIDSKYGLTTDTKLNRIKLEDKDLNYNIKILETFDKIYNKFYTNESNNKISEFKDLFKIDKDDDTKLFEYDEKKLIKYFDVNHNDLFKSKQSSNDKTAKCLLKFLFKELNTQNKIKLREKQKEQLNLVANKKNVIQINESNELTKSNESDESNESNGTSESNRTNESSRTNISSGTSESNGTNESDGTNDSNVTAELIASNPFTKPIFITKNEFLNPTASDFSNKYSATHLKTLNVVENQLKSSQTLINNESQKLNSDSKSYNKPQNSNYSSSHYKNQNYHPSPTYRRQFDRNHRNAPYYNRKFRPNQQNQNQQYRNQQYRNQQYRNQKYQNQKYQNPNNLISNLFGTLPNSVNHSENINHCTLQNVNEHTNLINNYHLTNNLNNYQFNCNQDHQQINQLDNSINQSNDSHIYSYVIRPMNVYTNQQHEFFGNNQPRSVNSIENQMNIYSPFKNSSIHSNKISPYQRIYSINGTNFYVFMKRIDGASSGGYLISFFPFRFNNNFVSNF